MPTNPGRTTPLVGERPRSRPLPHPSCTPSPTKSPTTQPGQKRSSVTAVTSALATGQTTDHHPRRARSSQARPRITTEEKHYLDLPYNSPTRSMSRRDRPSPSTANTAHPTRRSASCSGATQVPMRAAKVRRWAGSTRETSEWDGLRRVSDRLHVERYR
jgi:hypothetical protein